MTLPPRVLCALLFVVEIVQARTVMAWTSASGAAQLKNETWKGVFDGVQASCGVAFMPNGSGFTVNETVWKTCEELRQTTKDQNLTLHMWVGSVPAAAIEDPKVAKSLTAAGVALAKERGFDGYSTDDESDCAPRSTLDRFAGWMKFTNTFADGLHTEGFELSAAVQAMFGIQDVSYKPLCTPPQNPSCSQACNKAPWQYTAEPRVAELMSNSSIDRWLEMDTYYFGLDRFYGALDWYSTTVAINKLGVAMMNRDDITQDGLLARWHAIEKSGAD